MKQPVLGVLIAWATISITLGAAPPERINYQGVLRDSLGAAESGPKDMKFTFYSTDGGAPPCPASGGTVFLIDQHFDGVTGAVDVTDGLFNVKLGGGDVVPGTESTLGEMFRDNADVYLEVQVEGETLCPRIRIDAAAYSLNSDSLDGMDSAEFATTSHGHSGADITSGTVAEPRIDPSIARDSEIVALGGGSFVNVTGDTMTGSLILPNLGVSGNLYDTDSAAVTVNDDLYAAGGQYFVTGSNAYNKYCMWGNGDATYCIGMFSAQSFGALNDFAMTFSMNADADRGWLWRDTSDAASDGAMSLTTAGVLTVKDDVRALGDLGVGTESPAADLHVRRPDTDVARIYATGDSQGSGMLYAGQSTVFGGGIAYDGDANPDIVGGTDRITFFRRNSSVDTEVFSYSYLSNTVDFQGPVTFGPGAGTLSATGRVQIDGNLIAGTEGSVPYNAFGAVDPASGAMGNDSDVFVNFDLEVGASTFLNRILYMESTSSGESDGDQTIYFYNKNSRIGERFGWDDSEDAFELTDDIKFPQTTKLTSDVELQFLSESNSMRFVVDADNNSGFASSPHSFLWYRDTPTFASANRIMQLSSFVDDAGDGDLFIDAQLTQNTSFDIAEAFLMTEPVEPGDLVRVDPARKDAVRLTGGASDPAVLGVVSTKPGIVMGGGAFSVDDVRRTWGEDIAGRFEGQRPALEAEILAMDASLRGRHDRFVLGAVLEGAQAEPIAPEDRLREAALVESDLEAFALQRFVKRELAKVALAGRVPVKVDASYGAIEVGDYLTPSPTPGVAMRATAPGPVIGTALEGLADGQGKILTFVHRGHYTPIDGIETARQAQQDLADEMDRRTPEPASGIQALPGSLQVVLDRDANDQSRFSVFRNGEHGLGDEVFRVDEEGNVFARGSFRPSSMDLAEYHPVLEPVEIGDVLVADRKLPGLMRLGRAAHDAAVVGIVSGEPGVVLGSGIRRIAEADPELAARLDEARTFGDRKEEAALWSEMERRFRSTHAPVALSGTVPCKVDAGYGAIQVGDLLTVSPTPGHAMRSDDAFPGTIIGKAMEPLESGTGMVRVLVMLR
jgi:hypothetical protein